MYPLLGPTPYQIILVKVKVKNKKKSQTKINGEAFYYSEYPFLLWFFSLRIWIQYDPIYNSKNCQNRKTSTEEFIVKKITVWLSQFFIKLKAKVSEIFLEEKILKI